MDPNTDTTADSRADPGPDVVFREVIAAPLPGTLLIDLDLGSLRVRTHDEPTVSLEASVSGWARDRMEFRVEHSGDELQLCGEIDEWIPGLLGGTRVRVYAVVPTSFGLDLHTGAGSVRVRGIGGSVAADTGAGIVEVDGAGGPVLVKTGGGAARVRNVDGDVRARTAGGLVDVRDVAGRVEARTLGGGIRVRGARGQVDARAAAGPISVSFVDRPSGSPIKTLEPRQYASKAREITFRISSSSSMARIFMPSPYVKRLGNLNQPRDVARTLTLLLLQVI